jgi:hypothetical protein
VVPNSIFAISLLWMLVGFLGQVALYAAFSERYPDFRLRPWWHAATLFLPSVVFWTSGMLRETPGLLGIGLIVLGAVKHVRRATPQTVAGVVAGAYLLLLFREELLPTLAVSLLPFVFMGGTGIDVEWRFLPAVRNRRAFPKLIVGAVLAAATIAVTVLVPRFSPLRAPAAIYAESALWEAHTAPGTLDLAPLISEPTWTALLLAFPSAVARTVFRPLPWEASSIPAKLNSIERVVLLGLACRAVVRGVRAPDTARRALRDPFFWSCLLFVALLSVVAGTARNWGAISRHAALALPFFCAALTILEHARRSVAHAPHSRILYGH